MSDEDLTILARLRDELSRPLRRIRQELGRASTDVNALASARTNAGLGRLGSTMLGLGRTLGGPVVMGASLAVTSLGAMGAAASVMGLKVAGANEQAQIGFTTMLGSAEKATAFLDDLKKFAASTPFEFPELVSASQKLLAMGFSADQIRPTLTAVGDAVAGLGGSGEMVSRVSTALGQMKAKGKVSAEEMLQLTEAGIPAWEFLSKAIGKSTAETQKLASEGAIPADKAIGALVDGMNSKFGGLMAQQSKSFMGLLSTLKDTVSMGLADAFKPVMMILSANLPDAIKYSEIAIARLGAFMQNIIDQGDDLAGAFRARDLQGAAEVLDNMAGNTGLLVGPIRTLGEVGADLGTIWTNAVVPAFRDLDALVPDLLQPFKSIDDVISFMAEHSDKLKIAIEAIVIGFAAWKLANITWLAGMAAYNAVVFLAIARTQGLAIAQAAMTLSTGGLATGVGILNAVMSLNPFVLIIAAIIGLALALVVAYKKSETFRNIVNSVWDGIKVGLGFLGQLVGVLVDGVVKAFQWVADKAMAVVEWLRPFWDFAMAIAGLYFTVIITELKILWAVLGWLWEKAEPVRNFFGWIAGLLLTAIIGDLKTVWSVMGWLWDKAQPVRDFFMWLGELVLGAFIDQIKNAWEGTKILAEWAGKVRDSFGGAAEKIDRLAEKIGKLDLSKLPLIGGAFGDTATSRMGRIHRGRHIGAYGGPGRFSVTSGYRPSGDHARGALDIVGSHLGALSSHIRASGGFAEMHGYGPSRHLHAIPAGDTATSRMSRLDDGDSGGTTLVLNGPLIGEVHADSEIDVERAVQRGIEAWMRDRRERA